MAWRVAVAARLIVLAGPVAVPTMEPQLGLGNVCCSQAFAPLRIAIATPVGVKPNVILSDATLSCRHSSPPILSRLGEV